MLREKIKTPNLETEIVSINLDGGLLQIVFAENINLSEVDLSSIEVLTSGGITCNTLQGFTTIYKTEGNMITLSNDGSVYVEPIPIEPVPTEPYVPTESDLARQEIATLKAQIETTDYQIIKCSEYQLLGLEIPYDLTILHTERQGFRDRINELELIL